MYFEKKIGNYNWTCDKRENIAIKNMNRYLKQI